MEVEMKIEVEIEMEVGVEKGVGLGIGMGMEIEMEMEMEVGMEMDEDGNGQRREGGRGGEKRGKNDKNFTFSILNLDRFHPLKENTDFQGVRGAWTEQRLVGKETHPKGGTHGTVP